ncbi:MAG: ATP synthase F1 subunit epsilon [Acidimicrobiales bacterium]|nr:ATP synthase F1 subunit epsilon [Acidimicrobiales bacterium]
MPLQVELVSPERLLYEGESTEVLARTVEGEIGFLPGHIPFVGILLPGVVQVYTGDGIQKIAVHSGFIELANDHLTLLSDVAELAGDIDVDRARAALERAEQSLAADADDADAQAAKARAEARLSASGTAD